MQGTEAEKLSPELRVISKNLLISEAVSEAVLNTVQSEEKTKEILESISQPKRYYFYRLNLTRTLGDKRPFVQLKIGGFLEKYSDLIEPSPLFSNIVRTSVEGPFQIQIHPTLIFTDKFAAEAVLMGANLFVPGVFGSNSKFASNTPVSVVLSPHRYPPSFGLSDESPPMKFHVANGIARISSKDLPRVNRGIMVETTGARYKVMDFRSSPLYMGGLMSDQTKPAMIAVNLLANIIMERVKVSERPTLEIFDTCAAPGHKTTALSELLYYHSYRAGDPHWCRISAIDRSANRLAHLQRDVARLGLQNIDILPIRLEKIIAKRPDLEQKADFLIFDPPCSALGTRPKIFIDKSKDDLANYPSNQRRLLKLVDKLLKPGGTMMYNTCTIPKEENEGIVSYALEKLNYTLLPLPMNPPPRDYSDPGIEYGAINGSNKENLLRFYPRPHDGSGYFISFLEKR